MKFKVDKGVVSPSRTQMYGEMTDDPQSTMKFAKITRFIRQVAAQTHTHRMHHD
jgi:hypothetical protein